MKLLYPMQHHIDILLVIVLIKNIQQIEHAGTKNVLSSVHKYTPLVF